MRHFSRNRNRSGMPAAVRRSGSAIQSSGRYNSNVSGHVRPSAISPLDTATWQLPILPRAPQYCRLTPTECRPCLGNPVSSSARMPAADRHTRAQVPPDRLCVPRRVSDEVLQRLIADGITQPAMHGLHRLAFAVVEQTFEVLRGGGPLWPPTETAAEAVNERAEPVQQRS